DAVVLLDVGEQVVVLHLGGEIEVLVVPEEAGAGAGRGLAVLPEDGEVLEQFGLLPGGLIDLAVNAECAGAEATLGLADGGRVGGVAGVGGCGGRRSGTAGGGQQAEQTGPANHGRHGGSLLTGCLRALGGCAERATSAARRRATRRPRQGRTARRLAGSRRR